MKEVDNGMGGEDEMQEGGDDDEDEKMAVVFLPDAPDEELAVVVEAADAMPAQPAVLDVFWAYDLWWVGSVWMVAWRKRIDDNLSEAST